MRVKLAIPLSLSEIAHATNALPPCFDAMIEYITTDTRECESGDLFFALTGESQSGEDYVNDATLKGAIPVTGKAHNGGINVKDTGDALLALTEYYLDKLPSLKERICITGSVGKTTTKEFLSSILNSFYKTHATVGNYNNSIGLPLTVLSAPIDTEMIVLEMGTNHLGEIASLSRAVHPTLAIITNIGTAHIGNLGSRELIAKEKSDIICGMRNTRLICEWGESLLDKIEDKLTVSCESSAADFFLSPIKEDISGTTFDFYTEAGIIEGARLNIAGRHILNSMAMAVAAAITVGAPLNKIKESLSAIGEECVRHRIIRVNDFLILDDSYNSSLESVSADLRLLSFYKNHTRSALLGDILELGSQTEAIHREMGAVAARSGIERLYLFGVYSHYTMMGALDSGLARENIFINTDTENPRRTALDILSTHKSGEIILFKASNKLRLSRIIDIMKNKDGTCYDR